MTSGIGSNPEDEYADDEYTDHDAEDREQPSTPEIFPMTSPKKTCSNSVRKSRTARMTGNSRYSPVSCPTNGRGGAGWI